MLTLRKKLAGILEQESLDLQEISQFLGIKEKEVLDHLQHIAKSARPKRLAVEPAYCKRCGFSFKKRARLNTPGRCPLCKSESISPPRFQLMIQSESVKKSSRRIKPKGWVDWRSFRAQPLEIEIL
jgi:predicted Zn-ribbon and HTH transcriptional regulator